jgi:hypothetical protein
MDISVCIVNWNTKDLLCNCIESINNNTTIYINYEIIVLDNNSSDGSVEMVRQRFPNCILLESKDNIGFSAGNNACLRKAHGKYIFFLNPDTILSTNALLGMFNFLEINSDMGAVGCKLLNQDKSIQFICARTYPTLFNQLTYLLMLNKLLPKSKIFSTIEMGYWDHKDSQIVDCLSGACIFARKSIIEELSGFDEKYFMYGEDVDLCYRIKKAGWKIYYLASEEIYHLEGQSSRKRTERNFAAIKQRESNLYFFSKHYGKLSSYIYRGIIFIGSTVRLIIMLISLFDFRKNKISMYDKYIIIIKYIDLFLWSIGLKKT